MVLNIDNTENKAFSPYKKVLPADPSSLMLALTEQDKRFYFSYCISQKKLLYTNAAFIKFFGEELVASPELVLKYIQPDNVAAIKRCVAELKTGIIKNDIIFPINLPGQKEHRLNLSVIYVKNQNGDAALTGYAEVIRQQQMQLAEPEEYHTKKKKMLNILSHDLLSPMGSIHNLAALLSRKKDLQQDPEVNKWVSLIEVISKKSINLIRGFVEKEFTEPGVTPIKKEYF